MNKKLHFFATTPKGLELLLVDELHALGALDAAEKLAGITFTGDLALAYKACLWSRLANRILLRLVQLPANSPEALYKATQKIAWDEHLAPEGTLYVNFVCSQSTITHSLFGAQKVKDAIVDQFREKYTVRPSVAHDNPDISIHVHLKRDIATISLDLSGESLHKRGYRIEQGAAPLKENLAAAILLRAGWKEIAKTGGPLLDPMCGSGTLPIEAALLAGDIAPGLLHDYFGFLGWKKHQPALWNELLKEARIRRTHGESAIPPIIGYDADPAVVKIAIANVERAGLLGKIHIEKRPLSACEIPAKHTQAGLVIVNPPYGERLGELSQLRDLYTQLANQLKTHFAGWRAGLLTGNPDLGKTMGLRAHRHYALFNGTLPCRLLLFHIVPEWFFKVGEGR
ncbi:MAG TPA: THUMP domain-containing protein [Gammaproteobacteria bacterium]|nr:THUMP domain-containing protein [Gammaproteobacteria bacterium]